MSTRRENTRSRKDKEYEKAIKKIEKSGGVSGASAFTQKQLIFQRLVEETEKYLKDKKEQRRGVIRGLSLAYAKIWANPYNWAESTKRIEKQAVKFAKEIRDVDDREQWWTEQAGRY